VCSERLRRKPKTLQTNRIDKFTKPEGWFSTNWKSVRESMRRHVRKIQHYESLLQHVRMFRIQLQAEQIKQEEEKFVTKEGEEVKALSNIMKAVYTLGLSNTAPHSYPKLIDLLKLSGANVGKQQYSRNTATRMVQFIGDVMQQTLVDFLVKNRPPLSIILDGSSDRNNNHYILVYLQTTEGNRAIVYFFRLLKLGKSSSAQAYQDLLVAAFKEEGLEFVNYIKEETVSVITDGAASMRKLQDLFGAWIRTGLGDNAANRMLVNIYCTNHKLNLITRNSIIPLISDPDREDVHVLQYFQSLERKLNEYYTFFKSASKRIGEYRNVNEEYGFQRVELSYLYVNRWIASEYRTIDNFIKGIPTLVKTFARIETSKDYDTKTRQKAKTLRSELLDKRFLMNLHFMKEYTGIFRSWSLKLQCRAGILAAQHYELLDLIQALDNLGSPSYTGDLIVKFLNDVTCPDGMEDVGCTFDEYLESRHIEWKGLTFSIVNGVESPSIKDLMTALVRKTKQKIDYYLPKQTIQDLRIFHPNSRSAQS
jgi:hypothetical protein